MSAPTDPPKLPPRFRKMTVEERRAAVARVAGGVAGGISAESELAEVLVENAVGFMDLPLGIAEGFLIDGALVNLPLATEEPSVVAAAGYMARIVARNGGFGTTGAEPLIAAHVYLDNTGRPTLEDHVRAAEAEIVDAFQGILAPMARRGGGFRGFGVTRFSEAGVVRLEILIDVCDAMGANLANSVAERAARLLEDRLDTKPLLAILSNDGSRRVATANCVLPEDALSIPGLAGGDIVSRIVRAWEIAFYDPARAVTHNKGIMNGVSALAAATGNDTRGIEAACHVYAVKNGRYQPLTTFSREEGGALVGRIELPVPLGSLGGAVGATPASKANLAIMGNPGAKRLGRYAAALGLAQNLAALNALVGPGIQSGHMKLHGRRLAFAAGARGKEIPEVVKRIQASGRYSADSANQALAELRRGADQR